MWNFRFIQHTIEHHYQIQTCGILPPNFGLNDWRSVRSICVVFRRWQQAQKATFVVYLTVLHATRLKFLTAFLLQISLTVIQISRDYTNSPPQMPTHLLYLFCNRPHSSCGRMAVLRGQSLPSAELAMSFVNCEKQRSALIVGMAGMSASYAKPPVNPIKCRELPVVWRE